MIVGGRRSGLNDEDIPAADVFLDLCHHLPIAELAQYGLAEGQIQVGSDLTGQRRVGITGKDHHMTGGHGRNPPTPRHRDNNGAPEMPSSDRRLIRMRNLAGVPGFEPGNAGIKTQCLTTWRHPKNQPAASRSRSGERFKPRATKPDNSAGA